MRLSREELLRKSGARPQDLDALEAQRMIVPSSTQFLFWRSATWYSQAHLDVLRRYALGRRAVEANRRHFPSADHRTPPDAAAGRSEGSGRALSASGRGGHSGADQG